MLWLTVVVALGVGWVREQQRVQNLTVEDDAANSSPAPQTGPLDNVGVFVPIYSDEPAPVRKLGDPSPNPPAPTPNTPKD